MGLHQILPQVRVQVLDLMAEINVNDDKSILCLFLSERCSPNMMMDM